MAKLTKENFQKPISEVVLHATQTITKVSAKTGTEYQVEAVPELQVYAISAPVEKNGKYAYSIIDNANDLEYTITAPNLVNAKFTTRLLFKNVTGGLLSSGVVWFSADSVAIVKANA